MGRQGEYDDDVDIVDVDLEEEIDENDAWCVWLNFTVLVQLLSTRTNNGCDLICY
jgi:hypothetical protein